MILLALWLLAPWMRRKLEGSGVRVRTVRGLGHEPLQILGPAADPRHTHSRDPDMLHVRLL